MKTITSPLHALAAVLILAGTVHTHAVTSLPLDPYPYYRPLGQPPGQTYGIVGFYRIDPTQSPDPFTGATIAGANPNVGNAFPGGIGVYSPDTNHFGIGLYDSGAGTQSTGLYIQFDQALSSNGLSVGLANFGLDSVTGGFDAGRVAPMISIYGTGGSLIGNFDAQAIIDNNALTLLTSGDPLNSSYSSVFQTDTWKLDLGALVGNSTQVRSFALGADILNGKGVAETTSSNPYYLLSVDSCNCAPIPEPGSGFLILSCALGAIIIRRRRL